MYRNLVLVAAVAALGVSSTAFAQASDSETTSATTTIVQPITLTKGTDLVFGTLARPRASEPDVTVTVAPGGAVTAGQSAVVGTAARTAASFTLTGLASAAVTFTIPNTVTMTGPGPLVLTLDKSQVPTALDGDGSVAFGIGGSLPLTASTVAGSYTGTFNVDVAYQ